MKQQKQKIRTVAEMPPHIVAKFGKIIEVNLPAGCGYGLVLFDAGRKDGELKYTSNAPADLLPKLFATVAWHAKQQAEPGAPMIRDISEQRDEALRMLAELKVRLPLISVEDEIDAIEQIERLLNPEGAELPAREEPAGDLQAENTRLLEQLQQAAKNQQFASDYLQRVSNECNHLRDALKEISIMDGGEETLRQAAKDYLEEITTP